jgi:tetratricopeptide (TPR) repeat protein
MSSPRRGSGRPSAGGSGAPKGADRRRSSGGSREGSRGRAAGEPQEFGRRRSSASSNDRSGRREAAAGGRRFDDGSRGRGARDERSRRERSTTERVPDSKHPAVPEDVDPTLLDRSVRAELRSLSKPNAEAVSKYLVAAGESIDTDPARALEFARAARSRAARVGAVREAVGIAAYHAGEWSEALTELRTARRISGDPRNLPVIADCERALGRPEQAAKTLSDPDVRRLDAETRTELLIVVAGARRDLGQVDAALSVLARGGLDREHPRPGAVRLWYAYADILAATGRTEDAASWFAASAALDPEGELDAAERAAALL